MLNIILLGLVTCFADISSDMVYPIVPLYLASNFGAGPLIIGLIEGIAESVASLLKVYSGFLSDKYHRKKPLAFAGYFMGMLYKLSLVVTTTWVGVLGGRVFDRIGKGLRTAPRDVMVSESTDPKHLGLAYGVHKTFDMIGSGIGVLIAYFLVKNSNGQFDFRKIFLWSVLPAIIGLFLFIFVKEKKVVVSDKSSIPFWKNIRKLNPQLKLYLWVVFLFTLGNSSNAFMILRAKSVGFDDATSILLFFLYHASAALLAIPLGRRSDKVGRKRLLVLGYILFSAVYFGFAFGSSQPLIVVMFIVYGIYTAATTGVERAYVSEISSEELRGTMLGLHSTVQGIALLPASLIAGLLWTNYGPAVPFFFGGSLALAGAIILQQFMKEKPDLV